ncbi:MurR/RpiR family transcriptional regulator [uncultured Amnibacterium sp.]|uniref:MurR/RpiR family transcriptional regulator n=1 Tax=uncultured Amnibacterium sp. TaxID=1631851 RepID=UPI0035CA2F5D
MLGPDATPDAEDDSADERGHATAVRNRILARWDDLPEATLRVARVVLDDPRLVVDLSIGELADRAATSAATVTRFCRQIGYAGYVALRMSVATELGRTSALPSRVADIARAFGPDDTAEDVRSTLLAGAIRSMQQTAESLDLALLRRLATALTRSRHVDLYGVGSSALAAEALATRLYRIGVICNVWSEVHAGLTSAVVQDEDCVAIGYSHTGRTAETVQMLREAGRAGAMTVAITNDPASPLAEQAELVVQTSAFEQFLQPDDLAAYYSQVYVSDLLYVLTAQIDFGRASRHLAASALAVSPHRAGGVSVRLTAPDEPAPTSADRRPALRTTQRNPA